MSDPIFIIGRFRSGTSLVWSWFDHDPECVAYYEPLHDNLRVQIAATVPTSSHRGIRDYWGAYRGILPQLDEHYRTDFGVRRLCMEPTEEHRALRDYLVMLIRSAGDRRPVLKMTRADFRISWLRREFPEAIIVYVVRNNRNVWLSSRRHLGAKDIDDADHPDAFEQLQWSCSMAAKFPFLWDHGIDSFTRHYYLWCLSRVAGERVADEQIDFDNVVESPSEVLQRLEKGHFLSTAAAKSARAAVDRQQSARWEDQRADVWFKEREQVVEERLNELGLMASFGSKPLTEIRAQHAAAWEKLRPLDTQRLADALLTYASDRRSEVTRLLGELERRG